MKAKSILLFALCATLLFTCAKKEDQSNTSQQYVTASGGLNMRNAPQASAQAVLLIPQNAEVTVLERAGEEIEIGGRRGKWTKIRYNTQEGWVFGGFLADAPPGIELRGSFVETAASESCAPSGYGAHTLTLESGFNAKKTMDIGDATGNFRSEISGTYKTDDKGELTIAWTQKEEQDSDTGSPLDNKKVTRINETEGLSVCDCDGYKALCGPHIKYVSRERTPEVAPASLIGRKFVCETDKQVWIEFVSERQVKVNYNECEGYGQRSHSYEITGNTLSFGSSQISKFKISNGTLTPIDEFISCGQCRNAVYR